MHVKSFWQKKYIYTNVRLLFKSVRISLKHYLLNPDNVFMSGCLPPRQGLSDVCMRTSCLRHPGHGSGAWLKSCQSNVSDGWVNVNVSQTPLSPSTLALSYQGGAYQSDSPCKWRLPLTLRSEWHRQFNVKRVTAALALPPGSRTVSAASRCLEDSAHPVFPCQASIFTPFPLPVTPGR